MALLLAELGRRKINVNEAGNLQIPATDLQRAFRRAPGVMARTASAIRVKILRLGLNECVVCAGARTSAAGRMVCVRRGMGVFVLRDGRFICQSFQCVTLRMHRRLRLFSESPESPRAGEILAAFRHFHRSCNWDHSALNNRCIVALAPAVAGALAKSKYNGLHPRHFLAAIDRRPVAGPLPPNRRAHVDQRSELQPRSVGAAAKRARRAHQRDGEDC